MRKMIPQQPLRRDSAVVTEFATGYARSLILRDKRGSLVSNRPILPMLTM